MVLVPIWAISLVGMVLAALVAYIFILRGQRAMLVTRATQLYNKITVDGSPEAIDRAKFNLAYQISQSNMLHEEISRLRKRRR